MAENGKRMTYAEPPFAVLGLDLVLVGHPVPVPPPKSGRVVNADSVARLDLETSTLKLVDEPSKRGRGISTRKDVFVHEQTPDEILVLPRLAKSSDLKEEDTIIVQHIVNLLQEFAKVTDTDVLGHLEAGNLVVATSGDGGVAVVHAQDVALLLSDADLAQGIVAPSSLVTTQRDTSSLGTVVDTGKTSQSTPTATKIEELLALLETDLLTNDGQLVVLELLEALLVVNVGDDTRGVNHARAQEPGVKVIATVVVVTNLLLVYWGEHD